MKRLFPFIVKEMDPTASLIDIQQGFGPTNTPNLEDILPQSYTTLDEPLLQQEIIASEKDEVTNLPPNWVTSPEAYLNLQEKKRKFTGYSKDKFQLARNLSNPYERLGRNIFMNRAGLKIASVDAIYKVSYHIGAFMHLSTPTQFKFADLAGAPGAFTQYIQWRRPDAMGYGISLKEEGVPTWSMKYLDPSRFLPYYGESGTGNLYYEWNNFVKRIRDEQPLGLDLVMGDGGFDVEADMSFDRQEFLSSRLVIVQLLTALKLLSDGGNFILKVFDTVTDLSAQVIYIASLCFEEINLFKPISSRPANSEKYLVCRKKRKGTQRYELLLEEANNAYNDDENVTSIISVEYPDDFVDWFTSMNDIFLESQNEAVELILRRLDGEQVVTPRLNLNKALILWNLPGNPITRNSKIKIPGSGKGIPMSVSKGFPHY